MILQSSSPAVVSSVSSRTTRKTRCASAPKVCLLFPQPHLLNFNAPKANQSLFSTTNSRRLRNRRPRIPHGRSPRTRRQRGQRPQSQAHHPSPPATRHPRRRRARYLDPCHDRVWRCATSYQPRPAPKSRAEKERGQG